MLSRFFTITLILYSLISAAQVTTKTEYDELNEQYKIVAQNENFYSVTIKIEFEVLRGYRPSPSAPIITTLSPKSSRIVCKLSKEDNIGDRAFRYRSKVETGCADIQLNDELGLLLPVAKNKVTEVKRLSYLNSDYGNDETPVHWNSMLYTLNQQDTIFSMRRGRVVSIKEDQPALKSNAEYTFTRSSNYILVQHEDCSFGRYQIFKSQSTMVNVGDLIEASQPLALAGGINFISGAHVRYTQYYFDNRSYFRNLTDRDKNRPMYMPLKFVANDGQTITPGTYTNTYTQEDIMQEMNKRERKKWLKKQNSK